MTTTFGASRDLAATRAQPQRGRYNVTAATLHWLIAALIVFQVGFAWWVLGRAPDHSPAMARALGVHMSIGITILLLSLARLAVRVATPPPPLPAGLEPWDRFAAQASHVLFYALIIVLPLTGWALASLRPRPILYWGLFAWPHLPGAGKMIGHTLAQTHKVILVWTTLALLALHVAGAIKNQFGPAPVFWRMLPRGKPHG